MANPDDHSTHPAGRPEPAALGASPAKAGPPHGAIELARLGGRRAAHGIIIGSAFLFIGASAAQIIPQVFAPPSAGASTAADVRPSPPGSALASAPDAPCADGAARLLRALDRSAARAWVPSAQLGPGTDGSERAVEAFDRGLSPEWEDAGVVERACGTSAPGRETWAALLRLRRANEQLVLHDAVELLRLRNDVTSHLATGLR